MEKPKIDGRQLKFGSLGLTEAFDSAVAESEMLESLSKAVAIGSLLFIPMFADAKDIQDALPKGQSAYTRTDIKGAMGKAYNLNATYGGMATSNACNAVARTLWDEARGRSEGTEGRKAVLSVILNRCGGNPDNVVKVLSKPKAFSGWNGYSGGWDDEGYDFFEPSEIKTNRSDEAIWRECNELASKFLAGRFTSTIGNFNSYMNKSTASKKNVDSWGKKCNLKIGNHHFGYLPENDGYPKDGKAFAAKGRKWKTVVVKKGDTLGKIAKANGTTVDEIMKNNSSIKDKDKIRAGQKIRI